MWCEKAESMFLAISSTPMYAVHCSTTGLDVVRGGVETAAGESAGVVMCRSPHYEISLTTRDQTTALLCN